MAKQEPLKIPYQVASLDAVPQPLRLFFVERDGAFHLNLDGEHPDSAKLAEFRENNRSLNSPKAELEAKLKAFEGVDPDEYRALKAKAAGADDSATKLAEVAAQLEREQAAHRATRREALVTAAFIAHGGEPKAVEYAHQLAASTFEVGPDGKQLTTKSLAEDGTPLTVERWLAQQQRERPFLFKPSKGGGAPPTSPGTPPAAPRIDRNDPLAFGKNAEKIARGEIAVG